MRINHRKLTIDTAIRSGRTATAIELSVADQADAKTAQIIAALRTVLATCRHPQHPTPQHDTSTLLLHLRWALEELAEEAAKVGDVSMSTHASETASILDDAALHAQLKLQS